MCTHLIPRNLGDFFRYLSAFLVSLSVSCSFLFAYFLMWASCAFVYSQELYIPGQLQITQNGTWFIYLGVPFTEKKILILI